MSETAPGHTPTICIVDDHPAMQQALTLLLTQSGYEVCGVAATIAEAQETVARHNPELVVVDISLGEESGLVLLEELHVREIATLVYSMHEDADLIEKVFRLGAAGYVTKRDDTAVLPVAVHDILFGDTYVSPRAARSLAGKIISRAGNLQQKPLSSQEQQILKHLTQGDSPAEIAGDLAISRRTVESYCSRIIQKLGLKGMKELRKYALGLKP